MKIKGYIRPDGKVGIRNHIAVIPASICASEVSFNIANSVEGAVALPNQHGCCQVGADLELTAKTLIGLGKNPNVYSVLVVGLGCEGVSARQVAKEIAASGKKAEYIIIQDCGGTLKTQEKGTEIVKEMVRDASKIDKVETDISDLILAIECGGSDTTSGLASNPTAGYVSDKLIEYGGTSIFSETTEIIGAEHILARRAVSQEVADKLFEIVKRCEKKAKTMGVDMRGGQPTPGNIEGGISTIEEKSLGCIYKGGTKPLQGVLEYAESPVGKGLFVMDTPGQDIESITGMTAGGAQIVIFTTGRGTPTGSPIAPVIKVTGNPKTYENMKENIDFNAGGIVEGDETIREVGEKLFEEMVEVANGKLTKAETLKHREFGIYKLISTF